MLTTWLLRLFTWSVVVFSSWKLPQELRKAGRTAPQEDLNLLGFLCLILCLAVSAKCHQRESCREYFSSFTTLFTHWNPTDI